MSVLGDGLSIANFAFAYAVNAGVLRKGCVLRCDASASNRKGECGGGVVYQRHRRTLMAKLKGQLQYEVSTNRCRCNTSILRTCYSFFCCMPVSYTHLTLPTKRIV